MGPDLSAVIFDVDGTLVDSERHGHRVAFNHAFDVLGLPHHWDATTYGDLLEVTGGRRRLFAYLSSCGYSSSTAESLAAELQEIKTTRFRQMAANGDIPLRPGVRRLIDRLTEEGVRLFIATTGSRDWVEPLIELHFGLSRFETILTGTDIRALKPEPDVYLEVLETADLDRAQTVVIEDSWNGLAAAHSADLACLIVRNEYTRGDVSRAELVVTGFGPGCTRLSGVSAPLPRGCVAPTTLRAVSAARKCSGG